LSGESDGIEQAVGIVNAHAERGVDLIKIMATGGMSTAGSAPQAAQYTVEELRAVMARAHELGLPVTAHAHAAQGVVDAVAGVDGVEHCTFMTSTGLRPDPATVEAIAAAGAFVGCTVVRPQEGMPDLALETIEPYWRNHAYIRSHGVRVVCCTDAGIGPHKPHDVLPSEVVYFAAHVGATNVEALGSVTSLAATACGLESGGGRLPRWWASCFLTRARSGMSGGHRLGTRWTPSAEPSSYAETKDNWHPGMV
jgi:imidazolonepropionase-like amidohydrolase